MLEAKQDKIITHALYGKGEVVMDSITIDTHQWEGVAAWCKFYNPQTAISADWPYMIPVKDLCILTTKDKQ